MGKKHQVYDFVIEYKREHDGNSPSIHEIMAATGIKTSSHVAQCLNSLAGDGLIERAKTARGIKIIGGQWIPPVRI